VTLDAEPTDRQPKFQEPDRARKLVTVLADAVEPQGVVVVPAREWELQDYARDLGCRVAVFSDEGPVGRRDARVARAMAWPAEGRIVLDDHGRPVDGGALDAGQPVAAQVAAALAAFTLRELARARAERGEGRDDGPPRARDERADDRT
jgi:cyanophycin synthetase